MAQTTARINKSGKHFEILVDLEDALKFKKNEIDSIEAEGDIIFRDIKKAERAPTSDLENAFGTTDSNEVAKEIIKKGEILITQDQRNAEQEKKFKQVVDFLSKNSIDPRTGNPHSSERIKSALEQSKVNIKNIPIENQIKDILQKVSEVIPLKLDVKNIKITVPAMYTGKVYNVLNQYKKDEKGLENGDLEINAEIPAGITMDIYDKLNSATQGSA